MSDVQASPEQPDPRVTPLSDATTQKGGPALATPTPPPLPRIQSRIARKLATIRLPHSSRRAGLSTLLSGFILVALLTVSHFWHLEAIALDIRSHVFNELPNGNPQVVIVSIQGEDYEQLFGGRSPLEPRKLKALIERILEGRPSVLGVDIDTSHNDFLSIGGLRQRPNIVWAQDAEASEEGHSIRPKAVLGSVPRSGASSRLGLALTLRDDDSVVRYYERAFVTVNGTHSAFGWEVAQAHKDGGNPKRPRMIADTRAFSIRYTDSPPRNEYSTSQISASGFSWNERIRGKVVLLGGRYDRADKSLSPYGEMDGVEVSANVIETELSGRAEPSLSTTQLLALGTIQLAVLVFLFHRLACWAAIISGVFFAGLSGIVLWLVNWTNGIWFAWLVGVVLVIFEALVHLKFMGLKSMEHALGEITDHARGPSKGGKPFDK